MTNERRSDMGQKILIGLIVGGFGTLVGFFINITYNMANEGRMMAQTNSLNIEVMRGELKSYGRDLSEIKQLLRRQVPSATSIH